MNSTVFDYPAQTPPCCPSAGRPPVVPPLKTTFDGGEGSEDSFYRQQQMDSQVVDGVTRYIRRINDAGPGDSEWVQIGSARWLKTLEQLIDTHRLFDEDVLSPLLFGWTPQWKAIHGNNRWLTHLIEVSFELSVALSNFNQRQKQIEPSLVSSIETVRPSEMDQNESDSTSDE